MNKRPYIQVTGHYPEDESAIVRKVKMVLSRQLGQDIEGKESRPSRTNKGTHTPNALILSLSKNTTKEQASRLMCELEPIIKESFAPSSLEISIEL